MTLFHSQRGASPRARIAIQGSRSKGRDGHQSIPLLRMLVGREKMRTFMKIRISLPVVALLAVWASEFAVAQTKPNTGSDVILGLESKWNAAYGRGGIATMNSLLADDFIITVEDGSTLSKSGYIAHYGDSTVHVEI